MANVSHRRRRRIARLLTTAASVVALLGLAAAPAAAAPGGPVVPAAPAVPAASGGPGGPGGPGRPAVPAAAAVPAVPAAPAVVVKERTDSAVSLLATGFARQANVEFTVTVGGCTGRSSMVATADALLAQFAITPSCAGPATATVKAGAQSATTSFVIDNPNGGVTAAPQAPSGPTTGSASGGTAAASTAPAATDTAAPGRRAVTSKCTVKAGGGEVPAVKAGDTVCFTGALPNRLEIRGGGTPTAPVIYSGMGTATVPGITARGDNIVLEGFVSKGANDNGIYVSGNNITVQDNDISSVNIGSDDVDAMRFFGNNITIQHNDSHDIWANESKGGAPHTDCMQTYTSDSESASSNIKILNNKCASAQFHQCLMAEGPHDDDGDGAGQRRGPERELDDRRQLLRVPRPGPDGRTPGHPERDVLRQQLRGQRLEGHRSAEARQRRDRHGRQHQGPGLPGASGHRRRLGPTGLQGSDRLTLARTARATSQSGRDLCEVQTRVLRSAATRRRRSRRLLAHRVRAHGIVAVQARAVRQRER